MKKLAIFLGTLIGTLGIIALVSGQIPNILPCSPITEDITFQKDVTIEGTITLENDETIGNATDGIVSISGGVDSPEGRFGTSTHSSVTVNGTAKTFELSTHGDNVANKYVAYMDRASDTHSPTFFIVRAKGTHADPDAVVDDDILGQIGFGGWDKDTGGDVAIGAQIRAVVNGTPGENDMPTSLEFLTSADASQTPTKRLEIDSAGDISVFGNLTRKFTVTTDNTNGAATHTVVEMLGGLIRRGTGNELTGACVDVTDTAANIVGGISGCVVGSGFEFSIANEDDTDTVSLDGGVGVTMIPNDPSTVIPVNSTGRFLLVVTNATASSEAVSIHALGYSTH